MSKAFGNSILVLLGLALLLAAAPAQQGGVCIYEVVYAGPPANQLMVAWTQPPCSNEITILNEQQHRSMYHSSAPTRCGKAVIYNDPRVNAPAADTFPQLCMARQNNRRALGQS